MFSTFADKIFSFVDISTIKIWMLKTIFILEKVGLSKFFVKKISSSPLQVMGLHFNNNIGVGSGFDINADYINLFSKIGFGFVEFGPITPSPQLGNDSPSQETFIFSKKSLISRVFHRNMGVNYLINNLENCSYKGIIGIHINKNFATPSKYLMGDLQYCMKKLIHIANYVSIDIPESIIQNHKEIEPFLTSLKMTQQHLLKNEGLYLSIVIRIPLDTDVVSIEKFCNYAIKHKIDAVNCSSPKASLYPYEGEMHGKAIQTSSIQNQTKLLDSLDDNIPIIASGGIVNADDALSRLASGAKLIQLNSGLLFSRFNILKHLMN